MVSEQQILDQLSMLRRAARRLCRNRLDAEDLLQDTLMRCLAHRASCHTAPKSWCYVILHNLWCQQYRKRKREQERDLEWANRPIESGDHSEYVYAVQVLDRTSRLNELQQRMLRAWLDMDESYRDGRYQRLAQMFGIPLGTVRSRLFRLREKLAA